MPTLPLDAAEREYLALELGSVDAWPPPGETAGGLIAETPDTSSGGGPRLRVRALHLYMHGGDDETLGLPVSVGDLWLIDSLILEGGPKKAKLPDGRPILDLARKVWAALAAAYSDELMPMEAYHHADPDDHADYDADTYVTAAATLLRSRSGQGAGEDLPPAAP